MPNLEKLWIYNTNIEVIDLLSLAKLELVGYSKNQRVTVLDGVKKKIV